MIFFCISLNAYRLYISGYHMHENVQHGTCHLHKLSLTIENTRVIATWHIQFFPIIQSLVYHVSSSAPFRQSNLLSQIEREGIHCPFPQLNSFCPQENLSTVARISCTISTYISTSITSVRYNIHQVALCSALISSYFFNQILFENSKLICTEYVAHLVRFRLTVSTIRPNQ